MDGTLTESRQPFDKMLAPSLSKLSDVSDIGIVSGSDYKYIAEQMNFVLTKTAIRYNTLLLPCNGTKYYTPPENSDDNFKLEYEVDMKEQLGLDIFKQLMCIILKEQSKFCSEVPSLNGHYVDYRGSMINWCPIGRNADSDKRTEFTQWDTTFDFRTIQLLRLSNMNFFQDNELQVKLGGDTSFDIFPKGWDKTYCLRHLEDYEEIWFVGDRCGLGGNDKELYDFVGPSRAFETSGPNMTKSIINDMILPNIGDNSDFN